MSPDDLTAVDHSWSHLRSRRAELVAHLTASFTPLDGPDVAARRAGWLVEAVAELVGLLTAPSRLGTRARQLARTWPVEGTAPSFAIDGRAWMRAVREVCPSCTARTERAWSHAWLLLSDELAEQTLSPFAIPAREAVQT